jgi:predicted RNA binding protein YcfA (HicA-like mRNA interferase family)
MEDKKKLLYKNAKGSVKAVKFNDLLKMAELFGFEFVSQKGSHLVYKRHDDPFGFMNFQPREGSKKMAKPYQVRQLLKFVEDNELLNKDGGGEDV